MGSRVRRRHPTTSFGQSTLDTVGAVTLVYTPGKPPAWSSLGWLDEISPVPIPE